MGDRLGTIARWRPYLVAMAALLVITLVPTVHGTTRAQRRVTTAPTAPVGGADAGGPAPAESGNASTSAASSRGGTSATTRRTTGASRPALSTPTGGPRTGGGQ